MIKRLSTLETNISDPFFVKIKSNFMCYETYDFCDTFVQELDDKITAYIGRLADSVCIYNESYADFDEINEFLKTLGIKIVFCQKATLSMLDYSECESGKVLIYKGEKPESFYSCTKNPDYKAVYNNLDWNDNKPDYNNFVSDLSFRLSHAFARIIQNEYGEIFTGWETGNCAVISAISVNKTKRGMGIGTKLLNSIISDLFDDKKAIYVYCDCPIREKFYLNNSFEIISEYAVGTTKVEGK